MNLLCTKLTHLLFVSRIWSEAGYRRQVLAGATVVCVVKRIHLLCYVSPAIRDRLLPAAASNIIKPDCSMTCKMIYSFRFFS